MKRLVIIGLFVCIAGLAHAQNPEVPIVLDTTIQVPQVFDIGGSGARARGMGSAYIATGDDAAALTFNPAGLFSIDKTSMTFGLDRMTAGGDVSFLGSKTPRSGSYGGLGFFSFVSPFRVKGHGFVFGLSYGRSSDEASNNAVDLVFPIDPDGIQPFLDTTDFHLSIRRSYHAQFTPVTGGVGTRLSSKLAAGFSIAFINGKSVDNLQQQNIAADWFVIEKYPQPVDYIFQGALIDTSTFSGVSFSLGFKYTQDKLALGAVFKLPYTLRQTTNRTLRATTYVNGLLYPNASGVIFRDGNVIDIDIPFTVGFGGAYKPDSSTTLAADFEYRPFSGKEIDIRDSLRLVPGAKDQEFFHTEDPGWRNALVIRGGIEHYFTTSSTLFPLVPLRAGVGFMPIPRPNKNNGQPSGTATALNLSLGSGVHWALLHLDAAYTLRTLNQTDGSDLGTTETNGKSHLLYLTFTGYF